MNLQTLLFSKSKKEIFSQRFES